MSHVDYVEDKWAWYLRLEYGVRTLVAYIRFGGALGMVQCRHAITQRRLRWRTWRQEYLKALPDPEAHALPEETPASEDAEGMDDDVIAKDLLASLLALSTHIQETLTGDEKEGNSLSAESLSEELLKPFWVWYWQPLLREFIQLMRMTHAEAVNVRLLGALEAQADALNEHERRRLRHRDENDMACDSAAQEDAVFVVASSDRSASANAKRASAPPSQLRYGEAVRMTYLLSEIIASELHCLRTRCHLRKARTEARGAGEGNSTSSAAAAVTASRKSDAVESSCVAIMLPNSVEYNPIWLACARAGCLQTLLGAVHSTFAEDEVETPRASIVYRPCATALINTNLASNAMLFHALECAGSAIFILDVTYAPLLFAAAEVDTASPSRVNVPACVKRVAFWRLGDGESQDGRDATGLAALTPAMRDAIEQFNALPYTTEMTEAAEADASPVLTPLGCHPRTRCPALDLWTLVKAHEPRDSSTSGDAESAEAAMARLHRDRRAWRRQHWLPLLSGKILEWYGAAILARAPSPARLTESYKITVPLIAAALTRFRITEPVLFIYTSGTTGLPKAARFSHLRFFATAFLSRLLSMREATRRVLREQAKARHASYEAAVAAYARGGATKSVNSAGQGDDDDDGDDDDADEQKEVVQAVHEAVDERFLQSLDQRTHVVRHSKLMVTLMTIRQFICFLFAWVPLLLGLTRRRHYTEAELAEERALSMLTVYNTLPMYHTVGCVFCLGHLLHALEEQQARQAAMRSTWREPYFAKHAEHLAAMPLPTVRMVMRHKYSASSFRADMARYHVTVVQYIGEILRYAVLYERRSAPQTVADLQDAKKNGDNPTARLLPPQLPLSERALLALRNQWTWQVPYAFGNGLRLDIWQECMDRLNVSQPVEFYSSTEGNIFLFNLFNIPGSIGHIPRLAGRYLTAEYIPFFPFRVLRFEEMTQEVWRDPLSGFCSRVAVGEAGEVCGEVVQGFDMFALRRFDGYHQSTAASSTSSARTATEAEVQTNRKLIRHVMWPNKDDLFFRSGDLIKFDPNGFCFFVDRVGETFRWKGENVSTLEVSNALNTIHTAHVGVLEAVVYGVAVPRREGRAGMAMLTLQTRAFRPSAPANAECVADKVSEVQSAGSVTARGGWPTLGPSPADGTPASTTVRLDDERRFLQDDLYAFLTGRRTVNGDGSPNQAALPTYAVPLFIRVVPGGHGGIAGTGADSREASTAALPGTDPAHASSPSPPAKAESSTSGGGDDDRHGHLRTSTFKYIKHLLVKEGYEAALSTSLQDSCWQSEDTPAEATAAQSDRYYVLVTNPLAYDQLCSPTSETDPCAATDKKTKKGYVPLTRETLKVVGDAFDQCGW